MEQGSQSVYYVYVLRSREHDRFYIGMTENLDRRIKEHNRGVTKSTKGFRPWDLFFFETFPTRKEARAREKKLKSGYGREQIRAQWAEQDEKTDSSE